MYFCVGEVGRANTKVTLQDVHTTYVYTISYFDSV